jgi:CxxC motif-containing protein
MTKEIICTVCPGSCRLTVSEGENGPQVAGNVCKRGLAHGISELTNPLRMLTSTVNIRGGTSPRLSVISSAEIPKKLLTQALNMVYGVSVSAPVNCGNVLIENICGTGVDILASRSMRKGA